MHKVQFAQITQMSKQQDLQAMLQKAAKPTHTPAAEVADKPSKVKKAKAPHPTPTGKKREAKRLVVYVSKGGYIELATLGLNQGKKFQTMLQEALNEYLEKHRMNPIA